MKFSTIDTLPALAVVYPGSVGVVLGLGHAPGTAMRNAPFARPPAAAW